PTAPQSVRVVYSEGPGHRTPNFGIAREVRRVPGVDSAHPRSTIRWNRRTCARPGSEQRMSTVRVLVGTRKGAFVLTSDGKRERWDVSGPHFGGWEIYHLKGSPADPNRLYASQTSGWFGQIVQRSNDGGKTWETVNN